MNNDEAISELTIIFSDLNDDERNNLRWHAKKGTPLCCGRTAVAYVTKSGGA